MNKVTAINAKHIEDNRLFKTLGLFKNSALAIFVRASNLDAPAYYHFLRNPFSLGFFFITSWC